MSSVVNVPFNYQPLSTTRRTSSYSLPAGRYALVQTLSPFFSIGGTQIYPSQTVSVASPTGSAGTNAFNINVPSGCYIFSASVTTSSSPVGSAGYGVSGLATVTGSSAGALAVGNLPGTTLYIFGSLTSGTGNIGVSVSYYYFNGPQTQFWVSGGASGLALDGNNYIVTEYNQIT